MRDAASSLERLRNLPRPVRSRAGCMGAPLSKGRPVHWRIPRSADRLPGMAYVIDRVDLLGYLASDIRVREPSTGTLVVRLSEAAACCLRETLREGVGQPLTLAFRNLGYYLLVQGGASTQSRLAAGAQVYAAGRLRRRRFNALGHILCHTEVICRAADDLFLRAPDGSRMQPRLRWQ